MIFSKKLRKTAASVLALVMVFAMSTGAFAYGGTGTKTDADSYYNVTVSYEVTGTLPENAQISIIALEGFAQNAESEDVKVTFDGNTANNVLWIDQQAAAATGTFTFQVDAAKVADNGFHVKSGVTGGETMMGYVTVASTGGGSTEPEKSHDASLSAISVNGTAATIDGLNATATVDAAVAANQITATVADKATYVVNATEDANVFKIVVTAEDGTTTKTYTLTVTVSGGTTPPEGGDDTEKPVVDSVTNNSGITAGSNPFGVENGKVVKVAPAIESISELPANKTIAVKGEEAFYTEYDLGQGTVIKFVTLITSPSDITASDIAYIDGTPKKLVFGNVDTSTGEEIDAYDVDTLLQMSVKNVAVGETPFARLTADVNGDGVVDAYDVDEITQMSVKNIKIPTAATN